MDVCISSIRIPEQEVWHRPWQKDPKLQRTTACGSTLQSYISFPLLITASSNHLAVAALPPHVPFYLNPTSNPQSYRTWIYTCRILAINPPRAHWPRPTTAHWHEGHSRFLVRCSWSLEPQLGFHSFQEENSSILGFWHLIYGERPSQETTSFNCCWQRDRIKPEADHLRACFRYSTKSGKTEEEASFMVDYIPRGRQPHLSLLHCELRVRSHPNYWTPWLVMLTFKMMVGIRLPRLVGLIDVPASDFDMASRQS